MPNRSGLKCFVFTHKLQQQKWRKCEIIKTVPTYIIPSLVEKSQFQTKTFNISKCSPLLWPLRLDLLCGPAIGACRTCRPFFGTSHCVWRAPSQLDSSWPAAPRGTEMPVPPMPPCRCHRWGYSPGERTEAETPQAWAQLQTSNRATQLQTRPPCSVTLCFSM